MTRFSYSAPNERELILEGWDVWPVPPYWLGTQWSYEDKQNMAPAKPLIVNRIVPFHIVAGNLAGR